jgi:hypothetical protein
VYFPQGRVFDESGERLQAEAVLAAGELPLFAR